VLSLHFHFVMFEQEARQLDSLEFAVIRRLNGNRMACFNIERQAVTAGKIG
jgi:hypothetical protein